MPSVRTVVLTLTTIWISLAVALGWVGDKAGENARQVAQAEARRFTSLQLADQMRQSSNDLTRMARLYVATGERRYRDYYEQILAIRNGEAPRPEAYDSSFWDRALDRGTRGVLYGPPEALRALMQEAGITEQEFAALDSSRQYSDHLARLERVVMKSTEDSKGTSRQRDFQKLVSADYHRQKARIMEALDQFLALVGARTQAEVDRLNERGADLRRAQLMIAGLMLAYALTILLTVERLSVRPLRRILQAAERFRRGLHGERAHVVALREISQLARAFNRMAASIQHDFERNERMTAELRAARDEAAESNARFSQLAGVVDVMFWISDPKFTHYHYISPAFERLWGRPAEVLYRDPEKFLEWTHFEDIAPLMKAMKAASSGQPASLEYRVHRADGQMRWVWTRAFPVWGEAGELMRIAGTTTDVTERRTLEDEMRLAREVQRASNARFGRLADAVDVVFWIAEPDFGKWQYVNPAYERLWGWTVEQLYADPQLFLKSVHPDDAPTVVQAMSAASAGGEANIEYRVHTKDGRLRWVWSRAFGAKDAQGKVVLTTGTTTDITERKALERELETARHDAEQARRRVVDITNSMPGFVLELQRSEQGYAVSYVSAGVETVIGLAPQRLIENVEAGFALVHPEDIEGVVAAIENSAAQHTGIRHEYRLRHGVTGETRWLQLNAFEPVVQDGTCTWRIYELDITERKDLERQLAAAREMAENANHAKSQFVASMSHEIRTPMIGVTGMLEVLSHSRLDPEQQRSVDVARQSADTLLQIIGDILDFSKIEAGKLELAPVAVSLRRVVDAVVRAFDDAASAKGLRLSHAIDERIAPAHVADPLRIRQILSNFLSNALKFTREGSVEVTVEPAGAAQAGAQAVLLRVRDTGIGVAPEHQQKLFEPFMQAEASTTRQYGGTGLGLTICRRLAELMGGSITMQSEAGAGTVMTLAVTLPLADAAAIDAGAAAEAAVVTRRKPSRAEAEAEGSLILLAEDHPTNRTVLSQQFDLIGFHVDVADDGAAALERWKEGRYAMVFTDCHMPRMDGYQLAQAIRADERKHKRARMPVVALTAAALKGEGEKCLAAGMDDVILKPVTMAKLSASLRRWLPALKWDGQRETDAPRTQRRTAALDRTALQEVSGGNPALLKTVLKDFHDSTGKDLETLAGCIRHRDAGEVKRHAHRIRGASLAVGATELAEVSRQLEAAGSGEDWRAIRKLRTQLDAAYQRVRGAIGATLETSAASK